MKLSDFRKKLNFTQRELAFALRVTERSVSRWETMPYSDVPMLVKLSVYCLLQNAHVSCSDSPVYSTYTGVGCQARTIVVDRLYCTYLDVVPSHVVFSSTVDGAYDASFSLVCDYEKDSDLD
jgi:DNA-binding XRE family transcriptional regulator